MLRLLLLMVSVTWLCAAVQGQMLGIPEGDICKKVGQTVWTCKNFRDCPQAAVNFRERPKLCGFSGKDSIICCEPQKKIEATARPRTLKPTIVITTTVRRTIVRPTTVKPNTERPRTVKPNTERPRTVKPNTERPRTVKPNTERPLTGAIANGKCLEYAESVFDKIPDSLQEGVYHKKDTCFKAITILVVGGTEAIPREFPHMALIGFGPEKKIEWKCGGSLVSERFVLSAAHCSRQGRNTAKWVRLGELNIATDQDEKDGHARPDNYEIINIINHPAYKEPSLYNDIALYKLNTTVVFNAFIRPICIVPRPRPVGSSAIITGWGKIRHGGRPSNALLKAGVKVVGKRACARAYRNLTLDTINNGIKNNTQFCAGNEITYADTCEGDSGGPLQQELSIPYCMYGLIGVTSFGYVCGGMAPAVYTRVSHFVPWIESIVWPNVTL